MGWVGFFWFFFFGVYLIARVLRQDNSRSNRIHDQLCPKIHREFVAIDIDQFIDKFCQ